MRGTLAALALVAATGVGGALAYASYTTEREFVRLVAAGDAAAQAGRAFQALEAYSGALALVPDAVVPYLKRGRLYQEEGESEAALRDFRTAADLDPSATRPLEWMGDISLELDRSARAADYFRRALAIDERNARLAYKLGVAEYRGGFADRAAASLDAALAIDAGLVDARFLLGLCQRDLGDLVGAGRTLEDVVKAAPAATGPREALAEIYTRRGDHERTLDQLEALSALEPTRPERLVAVALAHAENGREPQALVVLNRAIERFPDAPVAHAALGHVWLEAAIRNDDRVALARALEALTEAATHTTATSAALADLGRAWMLAGDIAAAERTLRQAVARLPVAPSAFEQLSTVAEQQERWLEARDALVQYVALIGDREPVTRFAERIAHLSRRLGEPRVAIKWLDRAIADAGPSAARLAELAAAAWDDGDAERTDRALAEGTALAPGDRRLEEVRRRVASDRASQAGRRPS